MTTTLAPQADRTQPGPMTGPDAALTADARRFSDTLMELMRVVQFRDRDRACCYDVSVSQCYALKGVVEAGGLTVNELAAHLYLDKSTSSRIANGMVEKGLLARERDAQDGRIVRLVPTERGSAVCSRIDADLAGEYATLLEDFDADARAAVIRLVERLSASFASRVETGGGSCCVVA